MRLLGPSVVIIGYEQGLSLPTPATNSRPQLEYPLTYRRSFRHNIQAAWRLKQRAANRLPLPQGFEIYHSAVSLATAHRQLMVTCRLIPGCSLLQGVAQAGA